VSLCDHCASGRLVFQYRSVLYFTSVISKLHYAVLLLSRVVCLSIRTGRLTYYTLHRCSLLENYFKAWRFLPITADYLVARCPHLWCRFIPVLCCGYSIIYGSICTSQLQNSRFDSTFVLASLQHSSRILHTLETAFTVSNFGQHTHTHTHTLNIMHSLKSFLSPFSISCFAKKKPRYPGQWRDRPRATPNSYG
jgi:hypothetical protein